MHALSRGWLTGAVRTAWIRCWHLGALTTAATAYSHRRPTAALVSRTNAAVTPRTPSTPGAIYWSRCRARTAAIAGPSNRLPGRRCTSTPAARSHAENVESMIPRSAAMPTTVASGVDRHSSTGSRRNSSEYVFLATI